MVKGRIFLYVLTARFFFNFFFFFCQPSYDSLERGEITQPTALFSWFLSFLLLIPSLCLALLSAVSSPHSHGSSGEDTVNFSAAWKTEQHQSLLSQGSVLISYLERYFFQHLQ